MGVLWTYSLSTRTGVSKPQSESTLKNKIVSIPFHCNYSMILRALVPN